MAVNGNMVEWWLYDVDGFKVGTVKQPITMPKPEPESFPGLNLGSPCALLAPTSNGRWGETPRPPYQVATSLINQLLGIYVTIPFLQITVTLTEKKK